jgi:serine/threonine-protein kinase SRPK3
MSEASQEAEPTFRQTQSYFQRDLKAIDPKALADAMGGDQPPEEPLLSSYEDGFGYFTAAAVGRSLGQYQFARKVRTWLPRSSPYLTIQDSSVGPLPHLCGSLC